MVGDAANVPQDERLLSPFFTSRDIGIKLSNSFVDTDNIASDHAWHLGLEGMWGYGPFSLLGEYVQAWVSSRAAGDPSFHGWYLTGSWFLTGGGPRSYDRTVG